MLIVIYGKYVMLAEEQDEAEKKQINNLFL